MSKADEAIERAKKEAEEVQTQAASDAVNPPKPAPTVTKEVAKPAAAAAAASKVVVPTSKAAPAPKAKQSIVELRFNEGMRDVEVVFVKDEGTMTPRKIEHALLVLKKKYREHLGKFQAAEARKQRAAEEAALSK